MVSRPVSPVSPAGRRWSWASSLNDNHTNQHHGQAARADATPRTPTHEDTTPDFQSHNTAVRRRSSSEDSSGSSPALGYATHETSDQLRASLLHQPRHGHAHKLWTPFYLRRHILLSFILLFVILIIVLAVLFGLSSRDERLASADSKLYYLWVYGPTAVFTSIAAFWAQVEYRSKQMTPWILMAKGPQIVRKSLILDYIDPMNLVSLWSSFRNRHWVVLTALTGTFLIQLVTVLSSGLFVSAQTTLRNLNAGMTAWDAFSGPVPATAGSQPAANTYGILTSNLSYPYGTHGQYSYQWFNSSNENAFNTTALVDVFSADLSCEVGNVTSVSISQTNGYSTNTLDEFLGDGFLPIDYHAAYMQADIGMETSSCLDLFISVRSTKSFGYNGSFCSNLNAQEEDTGRFVLLWGAWTDAGSTGPVKRAAQDDIQLDDSWTTLRDASSSGAAGDNTGVNTQTIDVATSTSPSSTRATITAGPATTQASQHVSPDDGDHSPSGIITGVTTIATSDRVDISPTPGVPFTIGSLTLQLAAPTFSPSLGLVCKPSYSIRKGSVTLSKDANGDITPSISFSGNETAATLPNVTSWTLLEGFAQSVSHTGKSISSLDMEALINATNPQSSFTTDANTTQAAVGQLFRLVSAQFANTYLKSSAQTQVIGVAVSQESRLLVHALSFWLTEIFLLLLTLAAGFLFFKSPTIATPRDPSTIAGLATILARSEDVMSELEGTGLASMRRIEQQLRHEQFGTGVVGAVSSTPTFRIESTKSEENVTTTTKNPLATEDERTTWYQPFAGTTTGRAFVLLAPLALILALELLYQYSARNNGLLTVDDTNSFVHYAWTYLPTAVMVSVGQLFAMLDTTAQLFNPYHNLRKGSAPPEQSVMENYQRSVAVSALCRAARKLQYTVVAAGLAAVLTPFLTIVISGLLNAEAAPTTYTSSFARLDAFDPNMTSKGAGLAYANLVLANNLSDPQWTHQTLALPRLAQLNASDDASTATLTLPAVRGNLNCTPASHEQIYCNGATPNGAFYLAQPGTTYTKRQNQLFSGDGTFGQINWIDASIYPACPAVIVAFGLVANNTITDSVSHLACVPYVEQVNATVTFKLPAWELDSSAAVRVDEATARVLHTGEPPDFVTSAGYSFADPLPPRRTRSDDDDDDDDDEEDLANLFPLVVHGRDGTPVADLLGPARVDALRAAVEKTYALVMAQVLNQDRVVGPSPEAFEGSLTGLTKLRLKQSAVSTRILEALLAAMFVCAALTFALLDTRRVLPKNPCSIAAVASLLAGSELLARIPGGAEWMDDKQLREKGVFEGVTFSLGWWGGESSRASDGDGRSSNGGGTGRRFGIDAGIAVSEKGGR